MLWIQLLQLKEMNQNAKCEHWFLNILLEKKQWVNCYVVL